MSWAVRSRQIINNLIKCKVYTRTYFQYTNTTSKINTLPFNKFKYLTNVNLQLNRQKHNKKNQKQDLSESDEDLETDEWEDQVTDKQTRLLTCKLNSLRADLVLKAGLGIARNKIETMFYESKIRVNGQKLLKKSAMLNIGDEIDIIKGTSSTNPNFLTVARVEIISASERSEGLTVKLRRNKTLTIENYEGENVWK